MTFRSVSLACLALSAALMGCEETLEGKFLDTEGIALVVDVTATSETNAEMEITFLAGGNESNTYIDLSMDTITATAGDQEKVLSPDDVGRYDTSFDNGEGGTEFTVSLERSDEDKSDATDSSGVLPDPFAVSVEAASVSRQEDLTISWEPSGGADDVRIDVDGNCVFFTFESGESDDGEFVIDAGDFVIGDDDKDDCEATVTVTRTLNGTADSVFDAESTFRTHQVRSTTFTSTR